MPKVPSPYSGQPAQQPRIIQVPPLDVSPPRSMRRAGRGTALLIAAFLLALVYLVYVLVTRSAFYMAKSGQTGYGRVTDRNGDVLFDGTKPMSDYEAGHFADVGNLIGDTSGQMSNTVVSKNIELLANYSFLYGKNSGTVTLQTTISHKATRACYNALGSKNGTVAAYNWKTGEMLVCMSKPCVDPALGYDNIENMPSGSLLCKAFAPTVPGSTQKVSTLIAAYEHSGVDAVNALEFTCEGSWVNASGGKINCHNPYGHGTQKLNEAFANSCNPYFAQLVQSRMLPLSAVIETYTNMGYSVNGQKAEPLLMNGLTIPAASATLTDDTQFETQWGCLGQGKTLVSPFQLMLWQGAIADGSGSAVQPYILASHTDIENRVTQLGTTARTKPFFTQAAAQGVKAVETDNAAKHYYVSLGEYTCGVKSGTAQIRQEGKEYENSLLTGFCLDDDCPVAFCVMIEERTGNDISNAQLAKVLLDALRSEGIAKKAVPASTAAGS
ncbi:MAG: ABC transporter permease [Oscillospiraceae bacterium]|nr:ABC transporter permease [Oscillospiraceae bacterium]